MTGLAVCTAIISGTAITLGQALHRHTHRNPPGPAPRHRRSTRRWFTS